MDSKDIWLLVCILINASGLLRRQQNNSNCTVTSTILTQAVTGDLCTGSDQHLSFLSCCKACVCVCVRTCSYISPQALNVQDKGFSMHHVYSLTAASSHLSAGVSGSIKRTQAGADSGSVANTPPCNCRPNPVRVSPLRTTSLDSICTTWPPAPTVLDARDTDNK